ncbi:glycosyltransferase family 4 protein [Candidatus Solirubrobacter pratensis]|uniref:glycosyltransferase family 4 protein n=1 Tax=Candidatus Solirubrobacter pratensis TaxID=1298857 RepID=UPI0009DBCA79|nr:glycosyltransferase family 4 protein [Candidatus Solirubrobacter pratensis]
MSAGAELSAPARRLEAPAAPRERPLRVQVVDPSAYAPAYDHGLCAALARAGAQVDLHTSSFAYGPVPDNDGYAAHRSFYRFTPRLRQPLVRRLVKLAQHGPDMLAWRRRAARADVLHLQWLTVEPLDVALLPRDVPVVFTAHEIVPRTGGRAAIAARRRLYERVDAVVVHTEQGRARLLDEFGVDPAKVELVPHGAFDYLAGQRDERPLPEELAAVSGPVVLSIGVWRPYHGLEQLLEAWRGIEGAELWIAGLPRMPLEPLRRAAPPGVRFIPRFVTDPELPAFFRRADVVVFPYRSIEASGALFSALPFGCAVLATAVGGFVDVARDGAVATVPDGDPAAMRAELARLLADAGARERLAAGALAACAGPYAWDRIAERTLAVYRRVGEAFGRSAYSEDEPVR